MVEVSDQGKGSHDLRNEALFWKKVNSTCIFYSPYCFKPRGKYHTHIFSANQKKKSLGKGYCASIRGQSHLLWRSSSSCTEYVYMSTQHPSCRGKTALPHSILILLTQMVDKWHRPGQAGYIINLSTVRDRGCLASCLSCQESVLLLWEDMLTHQLSILFPLSYVLWSKSSN